MKYSSYGDTDFVTGLRAIAALMVVVVHTAAFDDVAFLPDGLSSIGKYGVQMFFVIAGFTVATNLNSGMSLKKFFLRRSFRILPPYFAALFVYMAATLALPISPSGNDSDRSVSVFIYDVLLHLTLLNIFVDGYSGSIMGVEWTVSVEYMTYFLLFFLLGTQLISTLRWWVVFVVAVLISTVSKSIVESLHGWSVAHVFPLAYLVYFIVGVLAFNARSAQKSHVYESLGVLLFVLAFAFRPGFAGALIGIATSLVLMSGSSSRGFLGPILSSPKIMFLGAISYSIYLYHMLVKEIVILVSGEMGYDLHSSLLLLVVLFIVIFVSFLSHRLIEIPSATFGRKLGE